MANWPEISQKILDKLIIEDEYTAIGLQISGSRPNQQGWLGCHALGRKDENASAAINVGEGMLRGRYRDLGGDGDSMTLWDALAKWGPYADWKAARDAMAEKVGLKKNLPKTPDDRPEDSLDFHPIPPHFPLMTKGLLAKYPGVTYEALMACGARFADYPKRSSRSQQVICLPGYGPALLQGGPRVWVVFRVDGQDVEVYKGDGRPPKLEKRIVKGGGSGIVGLDGIARLETAKVVIKVEGITDLLALQSSLMESSDKAFRDSFAIITNACGANESHLPREMAHIFSDKAVVIIHDADLPGQDGAKLWAEAALSTAKSVRNLQLPYTIEEKHGKDLRDLLMEGIP